MRARGADGWIEVSTGGRDGMAHLSVANGGPVIEETDVASLFEPFRRLCPHQGHDARGGVGLGLSIAASVVAARRGQITVRPLPDGGLKVLILLPASR
jgi:signal transduction histidine kinase